MLDDIWRPPSALENEVLSSVFFICTSLFHMAGDRDTSTPSGPTQALKLSNMFFWGGKKCSAAGLRQLQPLRRPRVAAAPRARTAPLRRRPRPISAEKAHHVLATLRDFAGSRRPLSNVSFLFSFTKFLLTPPPFPPPGPY